MQLRQTTVRGTTLWPARGTGLPDLVAALKSTPSLPDAACVGQHATFDLATGTGADARKAQAGCADICQSCPVLAECRRWAMDLPATERKALGVVGGLVPVVPAKRQPDAKADRAIARAESPAAPRNSSPAVPRPSRRQREAQRQRIERLRAERRARQTTAQSAAVRTAS